MLCYRCGSHVPDSSESCEACGQKLEGSSGRQPAAGSHRRRVAPGAVEGAPYRSGDLIAGRYEVKEVVGAGPLGFVFRCRDKELDFEVALKAIHPRLLQADEEREVFFKVIRQARRLSHQNLARVTEDGEDNGWPFYVTQFLEGMSLRKIIDLRLAKGQVFTLTEIEPIIGQITNALASAHRQGPHTNLKPENVIVLPDLLKVTDFGLGVALPRTPFIQAQRGRRVDHYYAPELIAGARPDARTDIYSLGVLLGELLTGLATEGGALSLRRYRPELPPEMEGLYRRAIDREPQARFATPTELFAALAAIAKRDLREDGAPPVPTARLPESSPIHLRRGASPPGGSLDATQPFDASMLPFLASAAGHEPTAKMGAIRPPLLPLDVTQPMTATMVPPATTQPIPASPREIAEASPPDATVPLDAALLSLALGNPGLPSKAPPAPEKSLAPASPRAQWLEHAARRLKSLAPASFRAQWLKNPAMLWLVLLIAVGLLLGTLAGYLLLERARHSGAPLPEGAAAAACAGDVEEARAGATGRAS